MRNRLVAIVAVLAVLGLIAGACAEEETPGGGGTTTGPAFESELITSGVLTVGSCLDYKPFEWVQKGDEKGFDVDLTEEIARRLGLKVDWITANFNTIFTAVAGHKFDMVAAAVTATGKTGQERAQTVAFSSFYYDSRQSMAVNPDIRPDLTSTDQLGDGDAVGVQKGTTGKAWAEENLEPNGVEIRTYTAAPDAFRDLQAGRVDAVINDEPASAVIVTDFPPTKVVQPIDTNEKYALAFAKDTPNLLTAVNQELQDIISDGTYEKLYAKYFPGAPVPEEFQPST
jgi:ABC-type amino acid transport substrate-binding protein